MAYDSRQAQFYNQQQQQRQHQYSRQPGSHAHGQYGQDYHGYDQPQNGAVNYAHGYDDRPYNQYYDDQQQQQYPYDDQYQGYQGQQWDQFEHSNQQQQYSQQGHRQYQQQPQQSQYQQYQQQQHYEQYEAHGQYDAHAYAGQYDQAPPRQYQYDDRYRSHAPPTDHAGQNGYDPNHRRPVPRRSPPNSRPGTSASRRPKQERILEPVNRESTQAMAWDNPFGVFPSKKDVGKKKKNSDGGSVPRRSADMPNERPSTSASAKIRPHDLASPPAQTRVQDHQWEELARPHTSHGSRPRPQHQAAEPPIPVNQQPPQDMPLRKKVPTGATARPPVDQELGHSNTFSSFELPSRPAPQRSASGPDPHGHQQHQRGSSNERGYVELDTPLHQTTRHEMPGNDLTLPVRPDTTQPYQHTQKPVVPPVRPDTTQPYQHVQKPVVPPLRPGTAQPYSQVQKPSLGQYDNGNQKSLVSPGVYEKAHYQSSPTQSPVAQSKPEAELPNFAAMAPGATESVEKNLAFQPKPAAYRKPTYNEAAPRPPPIRPGLLEDSKAQGPDVHSPLSDFNFELPDTSVSRHSRSQSDQQRMRAAGAQPGPNGGAIHPQFPPRNGSRAQPPAAPALNHSRNPSLPNGQNAPGPYQQPYNDPHDPRIHPPLSRAYTEPVHQQQQNQPNDGYAYDQQGQMAPQHGYENVPRNDYNDGHRTNPQQNQHYYDEYSAHEPPRPRTANSSRPTPNRFYGDAHMPTPDSMPMPRQQPQGLPRADRNHPVPVRPGLMAAGPGSDPTLGPAQSQMQRQAPGGLSSQQYQNMARMQTPAPGPVPVPMSAPAPVPTPAPPHPQQAAGKPVKTPVTIAELNRLRHAFKDRPNDSRLGLEFAERLVEAAVLLADEGGKADAKATAKNRERYVNDAYRIVKRLVGAGSPEAMFYLADSYGQGTLGLEVNPKEAFQLYTSAAKLGHPQSAYRVAVCCELGPDGGGGTRRDHVKAVQFYKRAATLGDGPAMFKTGMVLLKGLLGQQPNRREGISWLKRAAERADEENPHALHELALLYENAQSTDVIIRDEAYAYSLFVQAANLGYKFSQHRLGSAFEYGTLGRQIDPRQSITWYSKAAQQGEHQSEFALSGWYLTGSEPLLVQSDTEAYLWARKAAQSGLAKAEYAMGYYTEVGIGCQPNLEEAKKWYFRAAAQMDNRAKERLEEIKRGSKRREKTRISRSHVGRQNEGECSVM